MANDIVQTIAEARVDARSLSEFVFKPAGFKVPRRLAPPIDTLQFYIDKFDATKSATDAYVATIPTIVNNAINNTAIEGGVLADTFVTVTANGENRVARTQRDKNADLVSVKDFGAKDDGIFDNTEAFQRAIDSGIPFFIPHTDNCFLIDGQVTLSNGTRITGQGSGSLIRFSNPSDMAFYGSGVEGVSIENIRLQGSAEYLGTNPSRGIRLINSKGTRLHNVEVSGFHFGVSCSVSTEDIRITGCKVSDAFQYADPSSGYGIHISGDILGAHLVGNHLINNARHGFYLACGDDINNFTHRDILIANNTLDTRGINATSNAISLYCNAHVTGNIIHHKGGRRSIDIRGQDVSSTQLKTYVVVSNNYMVGYARDGNADPVNSFPYICHVSKAEVQDLDSLIIKDNIGQFVSLDSDAGDFTPLAVHVRNVHTRKVDVSIKGNDFSTKTSDYPFDVSSIRVETETGRLELDISDNNLIQGGRTDRKIQLFLNAPNATATEAYRTRFRMTGNLLHVGEPSGSSVESYAVHFTAKDNQGFLTGEKGTAIINNGSIRTTITTGVQRPVADRRSGLQGGSDLRPSDIKITPRTEHNSFFWASQTSESGFIIQKAAAATSNESYGWEVNTSY